MADPAAGAPPELAPEQYPPYVTTPEERRRWEGAHALAEAMMGDRGEQEVWPATRAIYNSDIPTDS